jgi:hypothetical protein
MHSKHLRCLAALLVCAIASAHVENVLNAAPTAAASSEPSDSGADATLLPAFASSATAAPVVYPGASAEVAVPITSDQPAAATVSVEIRSPSDVQVFEQVFEGQVFGAGERKVYTVAWRVPEWAEAGAHVVKLGIVSPDRRTLLHWNNSAVEFRVVPPFLFGLGPQADDAARARLVQESPVRLLTSWYTGPDSLPWVIRWREDVVPQSYAKGYALHLIVFSDVPEVHLETKYGPACGRSYPLSDRFLDDMRQLAQAFAGRTGDPPLFVTLFTEFQTYACTDNAWSPDSETTAYWRALKDQYQAARAVIRRSAPNARVSLGWGGWQTRFDDPETGAGRSMFEHFADVMRVSDFQSFQAMQSDTNAEDVRAMVQILHQYGPVLLAHYKPDNASQRVFDNDLRELLTERSLSALREDGLFGWSFMDQVNMNSSEATYDVIKQGVLRFGAQRSQ